MDYKLLALDLDGTLLNDEELISDSNIDWVRKASKKGVRIIVATGRSYNSAKRYIQIINIPDPVIVFNGAVIRKGEEILRKITLKNEMIQELVKFLKDMEYCPIVYTAEGDKYYETLEREEERDDFETPFRDEIDDLDYLLEFKWVVQGGKKDNQSSTITPT